MNQGGSKEGQRAGANSLLEKIWNIKSNKTIGTIKGDLGGEKGVRL